MRPMILALAAAFAFALAAPTASAEPSSSLVVTAPASAQSGTPAPIQITLTLGDFTCPSDATFAVDVSAAATNGSAAALDATKASFVVPAGSYAFDSWSGNATVNLTINATTEDDIMIHAAFSQSDGSSCLAIGGFPAADANATVHVAAPPVVTPTHATNGTATNTTNVSSNATSSSNGSVDTLPATGGNIGNYKPTESKGTPAPALFAVLGAVGAAAAVVAGRRR